MTMEEYDLAKKQNPALGDPILIPRWLYDAIPEKYKRSPRYVVADKIYGAGPFQAGPPPKTRKSHD
jgi:hypothetical protein